MSNSIRFIKSNRGKHDQIIFENNIYWHNKTYPSQAKFYQCQHKKSGCPGKITVSPGKSSISKQVPHLCIGPTNEAIKVIEAKQELKSQLKDPNFSQLSAQSIYQNMEISLASGDNPISYKHLAKLLKPYKSQANTYNKIRQKLIPSSQRK